MKTPQGKQFLFYIYKGDDPLRTNAGEANPSLGYTFSDRYLQRHKLEIMPAKESIVVSNFCQWVDADNPWIMSWNMVQCNTFTFDDLQVKSVVADWTYREQRFNRISHIFSP